MSTRDMQAPVTPLVGKEHVKARYRPFFVALHAAAIRSSGGVTALAHMQGRNPHVLANALNPNVFDAAPSADVLLTTMELVQPVEALNALALMMGRTTVPVDAAPRSPREAMHTFLALVNRSARATELASEALEDGRIDAQERAELGPLLDALIAAAVEFRAVVQS